MINSCFTLFSFLTLFSFFGITVDFLIGAVVAAVVDSVAICFGLDGLDGCLMFFDNAPTRIV